MVEIAKRNRWQLTVIVFDGESVSPVSLLRVAFPHGSLMDHDPHTWRGRCGGMEPHVLLPHLFIHC